MLNKKRGILIIICMFLFLRLPACKNNGDSIQYTAATDTLPPENAVAVKIDPYIFNKYTPLDKIEKKITVSDYVGAPEYLQIYTLSVYKDISDFTDIYGGKQFQKIVFDDIDTYENFGLAQVYKQYLYFHVVESGGKSHVLRYNMDNGSRDIVFTYGGEYQTVIYAANDNYIIWQEDKGVDWSEASLNCYNIKTGYNETFFPFSRDEKTGLNYTWNFGGFIIDGTHVYFNYTEKIGDTGVTGLYEYDTVNNAVKSVDENIAAYPFKYKGISWLSYDENKNEYFIKNINDEIPISIGSVYAVIYASDNIIAGYKNSGKDGIMYYDGKDSVPIIESTGNIDGIYCTDSFITWDGWSNDSPLFYDIKKQAIISVGCLEVGKRYAGYADGDYLIFGAHDYIPAPLGAEGEITTKSLIYYYIKTADLN